ncbi:MAG: hypothetical protein BMS9Abin02_0210 [Anaerolineae bacterium]|nr:MAG: hypothetical protein BMS9Abin02_0210 [Anaerolineae bacterium]
MSFPRNSRGIPGDRPGKCTDWLRKQCCHHLVKSVFEITRTKAQDISQQHEPPFLPVGAAGKSEAIMEEADRELNGLSVIWILSARRSN